MHTKAKGHQTRTGTYLDVPVDNSVLGTVADRIKELKRDSADVFGPQGGIPVDIGDIMKHVPSRAETRDDVDDGGGLVDTD